MTAAAWGKDGADLRRRQIADAYCAACALELDALKPGNVHRESDGHGMTVADFLRSAEVSAGPLTEPGLGLGERVYRAVAATREAVGCNTNLGIVLLCAPLVQAALEIGDAFSPLSPALPHHGGGGGLEQPLGYSPSPGGRGLGGGGSNGDETGVGGDLRDRLQAVLRAADRQDTDWLFQAIRLAAPGGLGESAEHDVAGAAVATPLEVMAYAAERDLIARQYATGYYDLFDWAVPLLAVLNERWQDPAWAAAGLYMDLLGRFPDTHIARKLGTDRAMEVCRRAAPIAAALCGAPRPEPHREALLRLDRELKEAGINPGTSADLTVACLLIRGLEPRSTHYLSAADARRIPSTGPVTPTPVPHICDT